MSRSIPKKRGNVKPVKGKKPARYTQKVDGLGRRYTIDNKSGKRVSNELWERQQAKGAKTRAPAKPKRQPIPRAPAKPKRQPIPRAPANPKRSPMRPEPVERSVNIPRNIFEVWDIPNAEWKKTHDPITYQPIKPLSEQEWEPEEWVNDDEELLFAHEKREQEAELAFRAAKAIRDRELLANAEEFIPPSRIKGFSEGIKERAERYPRVKRALTLATDIATTERSEVIEAQALGYQPSKEEFIRGRFLHALEQDEDIESVVGDLSDMFEEDVHDIYEIYFSPEVA